ncbi:hypothetical protein D3C83_03700 [compost metagenome]
MAQPFLEFARAGIRVAVERGLLDQARQPSAQLGRQAVGILHRVELHHARGFGHVIRLQCAYLVSNNLFGGFGHTD